MSNVLCMPIDFFYSSLPPLALFLILYDPPRVSVPPSNCDLSWYLSGWETSVGCEGGPAQKGCMQAPCGPWCGHMGSIWARSVAVGCDLPALGFLLPGDQEPAARHTRKFGSALCEKELPIATSSRTHRCFNKNKLL